MNEYERTNYLESRMQGKPARPVRRALGGNRECKLNGAAIRLYRDVPKDDRQKDTFPGYLRNLMSKWEQGQQPPHWALNGGGKRVKMLMDLWGLSWKVVAAQIEPDTLLQKMSDTELSEVAFIARLDVLKSQLAPTVLLPAATDDKTLSPATE